ncbi:galactose oxidase protein [Salinisphaera shabanensis E1L3A]|uniref:Galactose oxidase protein n=1 Tax=Salinisphaera shabanensis E1L3A TaxID=1033802 RepID=U2E225_9GAMM|nr:galactose oxidase-like domain-containing protein [Salinisphaera shabanensis]ERJ17956.1 galactose oxidase protein [Salinisphaera shabanensis E1L3A]
MRMTLSAATTAALTLCLTSSPALAALDDGVLGDLLNAGKPDTSTQANPDGADRAAAEDEAAPSSAALPGNETTASAPTNVPAHIGGRFSEPFSEPTLVVDGKEVQTEDRCMQREDGTLSCKPAAGTVANLGDGRFVYLNALEGTENVELSIVAEFGEVTVNDQSRVLTLDADDTPSWKKPTPNDGGANPNGNDSETIARGLPGVPNGILSTADNTAKNDGALFCADVVFLADGSMMAVGGTDYYTEPGVDGLPVGVVELEGLKSSRIFDPQSNTWTQSGDMTFGRWYPTLVTLADGDVFVASGVTKLLKPVYPEEPLNSGRNVAQTETYDLDTGSWSDNGEAAQRSLPLFPRLHLLPNGQVYYNAGGQAFNPFGQAYDQALWNIVAAYDPDTQQWTDLGYAGLPLKFNEIGLKELTSTVNITNANPEQATSLIGDLVGTTVSNPTAAIQQLTDTPVDARVLERTIGSGMRGSTFSAMLPLRPDENGGYHEAEFLTAGGVPTYVTVGSPGGYLPVSSSRIDTVEVNDDEMSYSSRLTGPLSRPRWYSYSVVMPDDSVMIFSGGDRDGVVLPGLEGAIREAERFDPETETWQVMASAHRKRTYHNTAVLMPDGRVLIGGHSPINTAYASNINFDSIGLANYESRDPSFEIYTPPYAMRGDRPVIENAPTELETNGDTFTMTVSNPAVDQVMLIRRTATTHLVDGDQRAVELPVVSRSGNVLTVQMTANPAVLPAGQYMLFASFETEDGMRVPSISTPVGVAPNPAGQGEINQPEPAAQVVDSQDNDGLIGGLLSGDGLLDSDAAGDDVSPLMPITDLLSGVTSVIPGPQTLIDGAPEVGTELKNAGERAVGIGADTATGLPQAGKGLAQDLKDGAQPEATDAE